MGVNKEAIAVNIAVVDDFLLEREQMELMVKSYLKDHGIKGVVESFENGEAFLEEYTPNKYAIVILDIYMNEKTGMDIAKYLREQNDKCKVLFATTSEDFAIESYEVSATYYLLKPIQQEKVVKALELCMKKPIREPYVEIIVDRLPIKIPFSNIYWVETQRNVLVVHLEKKEIKTYMTFQSFVETLKGDPRFLVSCKGCLVNMDYIVSMEECDFVMKNKDYVQIRKRGGNQIKTDYLQYICKKIN